MLVFVSSFLACVTCGDGTELVGGECKPSTDDTGSSGDDVADADTDTDADADADADADGPFVFVTSGTWSGDLATAGGKDDGLASADALCNAAANAAGLPGRYDAWLSTDEVDAVDHITGEGPWRQVGTGVELFSNRSALSGTPRESIANDEYGDFALEMVWTGTATGGRKGGDTCGDWAYDGGTGEGLAGSSDSDNSWTDSSGRACDEDHSLYCFQH